ncbi:hypothetical protein BDN70DRAFT_900037 [Pholiota conissans]|uniref:DUF6532 domain-containing protein n=1 Tax=Pholiota conissans TaxID=109636 RepID=A0A9P5YQW2_9AGAR|nr:hypothetical protein BDN70DRAFT_900037 [Pholiota conissans]
MYPSTRRTRAKNANTHPGDAIPKQSRRTKEQIEAAKEAEKIAKKKKEAANHKKLANIAQAADNIVLEAQAQAASEPRVRPSKRPLKREYAMLNVTDADKENHSATDTGEQSDSYAPSEAPTSEPIIDPASDSDNHASEPPQKKRGRPKKALVLKEVKARRRHLDPILEIEEHESLEKETRDDILMTGVDEREVHRSHAGTSQGLPFKAGLKKSWMSQRNGNSVTVTQVESQNIPQAKARSSVVFPSPPAPETPLSQPGRPRPRPRPRRPNIPEVQAPDARFLSVDGEDFCNDEGLEHSPVKIGGGIPDDECDLEEYEAAKSSPVKAGKRVTSNGIVNVHATAQTAPNGPRKDVPPFSKTVKTQTMSQLGEMRSIPNIYAESGRNDFNINPEPIPPMKEAPRHPVHRAAPTANTYSKPSQNGQKHNDSDNEIGSELDEDPRASVAPSEGINTSRSRRFRGAGRSNAPTYDSLPDGATREIFKEIFMPTVAKYLVKLTTDIWSTNTAEYTRVIQAVWNQVFPKATYTFSQYGSRCEVTRLITQRTYEWRSRFASSAIDAVLDLEASGDNYQDPGYRADWVSWVLDENFLPFLYSDNESDNPEEWSGTFASTLITKTLASHLTYTADAIIVKKLKDLEAKQPTGALALATTAVERALILWDEGLLDSWHRLRDKDRPSLPKFDAANWSSNTKSWYAPIATLDSESWKDLLEIASEHMKPVSRKPPTSKVVNDGLGNRALLVARPRRK